ncbi:hypothetical protein ACJX0J_033174 [Zea mays]
MYNCSKILYTYPFHPISIHLIYHIGLGVLMFLFGATSKRYSFVSRKYSIFTSHYAIAGIIPPDQIPVDKQADYAAILCGGSFPVDFLYALSLLGVIRNLMPKLKEIHLF